MASAPQAKPLDAEWTAWLHANIARGCPLEELRGIMRSKGLDEQTIAAAIAAAPEPAASRPTPSAPPDPAIPRPSLALPGAVAHAAGKAELYVVDGFLGPEECAELVRLIVAQLRPSVTTTPAGAGYDSTYRTSRTCDLAHSIPAVARLDAKICAAMGFDPSMSEPTQGQHYEIGQVFKTHTDFFKWYELEKFMTPTHGQRTWTFMVYLHEPEGGGETEFPELGLKVAPRLGRALLWNNLHASGRGNESTQHQSLPVTGGTKTIITKWFRMPRSAGPKVPQIG